MQIIIDINDVTGRVIIQTTINKETVMSSGEINVSKIDKSKLHDKAKLFFNSLESKELNVKTIWSRMANQNPYMYDPSTHWGGIVDKSV